MEQHFRNYQINHKFDEKGRWYCCWKLRKRKVRNKKNFRNYSSRLARILRIIRAGRARTVEGIFTRKLNKNYAYLEILVQYLNNPSSEEAIFGSYKINEGGETMKLENEEVMLKNT